MRILSRKSLICGEVYSPVLKPSAASAEASMLETDPLPLVPAIWTVLYRRCGCPASESKNSILSSPGLYAPAPIFWNEGNRTKSSFIISP